MKCFDYSGEVVEDVDQVTSTTVSSDNLETQADIATELMPPPLQILPPGCPAWAARMKNVEVTVQLSGKSMCCNKNCICVYASLNLKRLQKLLLLPLI